ncbi:type II toxin-antitoxin system VapC family toxin [Nocardioides sp. LHD-245]|uniref:type II toxin-antitoxin system VapC family toxin n=1 Tax=Nocardioides sp. LHD-245 TaxID=3051387 RepID=UPI0027E19021|nr:type II toxin-antitoxin system VapC family toxin [Nocardioides sp. LHD-245]
MILVDTSVWIDHLHRGEPHLVRELGLDEVGGHPAVVEELALGNMRNRAEVLRLLGELRQFPVLRHSELVTLVDGRRLWGRGLSPADAHLLGACLLLPGARLWTRDKRLRAAAADNGVAVVAWR